MTEATPRGLAELSLAECHHCHQLVPVGTFCGHCGAHLAEAGVTARFRRFAYAASPGERVARPAVVSTLFPHLPHRHADTFRNALAGGIVLVGILTALQLFAPATVAAAVILPILYVIYLYEVEVYEHEPVTVLAATFILGALLGVGFALLSARFVSPALGPSVRSVLVYGLVFPVVGQGLMFAGPLLLLGRRHFDEALDGLSFGVASAVGFTMSTIVAGSWHVLTAPLFGSGVAVDEILRLLRLGIFGAVVNASTTALITASLWLSRHDRARGWHAAGWRSPTASIMGAFLLQIGLGVAGATVPSLLGVVVIWAVAAAAALVWLRVVIHHALLDEGAELEVGAPAACSECHRLVPTMLFCPACGVARSAASKHARTGSVPLTAAGAPM